MDPGVDPGTGPGAGLYVSPRTHPRVRSWVVPEAAARADQQVLQKNSCSPNCAQIVTVLLHFQAVLFQS